MPELGLPSWQVRLTMPPWLGSPPHAGWGRCPCYLHVRARITFSARLLDHTILAGCFPLPLMQAGADVSATNVRRLTPLLAAAGGGHTLIMQALLRHAGSSTSVTAATTTAAGTGAAAATATAAGTATAAATVTTAAGIVTVATDSAGSSSSSSGTLTVSRLLEQLDADGNGPLHFCCGAGERHHSDVLPSHSYTKMQAITARSSAQRVAFAREGQGAFAWGFPEAVLLLPPLIISLHIYCIQLMLGVIYSTPVACLGQSICKR